MGTEAAPPRSKKIRRSAPQGPAGQQPGATGSLSPPPASDAPADPVLAGAGGGGSGTGEADGGVGEDGGGDGVDRIGALPDAILQEIISLLPTKDGGRVRTLDSHWRRQWCFAPLNLDCLELPAALSALAAAVSRILSAHRGPGRSFRIDTRLLRFSHQIVDAWFRSPALDSLQELDMSDHRNQRVTIGRRPPLPSSAFRFSACLRVATLKNCSISDDIAKGLVFPQIQKLAIERVNISDASLQSIIAGCPILECLLLSLSSCRVSIKSASLRSLGVYTALSYDIPLSWTVEIVIEQAPCLEKLVCLEEHRGLRVSVMAGAAPNLETLGCLYDTDRNSRFAIGSTVIEGGGLRVVDPRSVVHSVKVLAVSFYRLSLDKVIDLMTCFPCLETLYVQSCRSGENNLWRRKHRSFIGSFDIRLKTVVFLNYRGIKSHVSFSTFFILNAKRLETMRFVGGSYMDDEDFLERQLGLLKMEERASIGAKFYFTVDKCDHYLPHIKHVHDLSAADPFECTC